MATVTLNATIREKTGKGAARKARGQGQCPAVVYRGGDVATPISIDPNVLELSFIKSQNRNTLVELEMDGGNRLCLVREAQRHPVSRRILHVDFYEVKADEVVTVDVPIVTKGTAQGVKLGGMIRTVRRSLPVLCKPADIPDAIEVDISKMLVGDTKHISDIAVPPGCTIDAPDHFVVLALLGKRALEADLALPEEEEGAEVGEGAEGEEGAEGGEEEGGDEA